MIQAVAAFTRHLSLPTEAVTTTFAQSLGRIVVPGDCLLLEGSIGAGKTTFARALVKSVLAKDEDVPSPTFTLVQTYNTLRGDIWHCDLYRLTHPDDVMELGLDLALDTAITLIEWPDRLGSLVPRGALTLRFAAGEVGHSVDILGDASWAKRLGALDV